MDRRLICIASASVIPLEGRVLGAEAVGENLLEVAAALVAVFVLREGDVRSARASKPEPIAQMVEVAIALDAGKIPRQIQVGSSQLRFAGEGEAGEADQHCGGEEEERRGG